MFYGFFQQDMIPKTPSFMENICPLAAFQCFDAEFNEARERQTGSTTVGRTNILIVHFVITFSQLKT